MSNPELLWHYTTVLSFIKIVEQNRLLATKATHLNDYSEFIHGWQLLHDICNRDRANSGQECISEPDWQTLGYAQAPYVFSLSEKGDLLSQWRAYAHPKGVAIGFGYGGLSDLAGHNDFQINRCWYEQDEKKSFIKKTLRGGDYNSSLNVSFGPGFPSVDLNFLVNCGFFKHSSFSEECEFRLVSDTVRPTPVEPTEWRPSKDGPIPKMEIKPANNDLLPVTKVRLSPGCNFEFEKKTLESFLKHHGYDAVEIVASRIPYRTSS